MIYTIIYKTNWVPIIKNNIPQTIIISTATKDTVLNSSIKQVLVKLRNTLIDLD